MEHLDVFHDFLDAGHDVATDARRISTNPRELFARQHIEHTIAADSATQGDKCGRVLVHRSGAYGA
ncbi:MAG TPA: hypothetical protein VMW56_01210, partial [Candidatus Margulisiibacteriota bacterium]|nr:hypothetical protein [Candidatus Margulisiibacteriota bacterium]